MTKTLNGIGASQGIVLGPAHVLARSVLDETRAGSPEAEQRSLMKAQAASVHELEELAAKLRSDGHEHEAGIIEAQILMLQDPSFLEEVERAITAGKSASAAVHEAAEEIAITLEALEDPYLSARAADVRDVAERLRRRLHGVSDETQLRVPSIIVAHDLTPSQTAAFDRALVLGFAVDGGSITSHTAILARALDIPAVVGLGSITEAVQDGQELILDGESGSVVIEPGAQERQAYAHGAQAREERRTQLRSLRDLPSDTRDGHHVILAANVGSPTEVAAALEVGAEGVGLFRTEFLFAERAQMPDEEEQTAAYRAVLEAMAPHTVVIRTLDVGGDKPLPYLAQPSEPNPFLGLRGVRLTLAHEEILRTQLRSLLRASIAGNLAIMLPMVTNPDEIARVQALLAEAREEVGGTAQLGIMIEVPAAALIAETLAKSIDFFSAGTNDLAQYTLAVDRINERVSYLYQPLHPAILRLLAMTARVARDAGIWAGICGEMAGDPRAIPVLVGLGFDELSMSPSRIPAAREMVRSLSYAECQALAGKALQCRTSQEVERLVDQMLSGSEASSAP